MAGVVGASSVWRAWALMLLLTAGSAAGQLAVLVEDEEGDVRWQTTSGNLRVPMADGEYRNLDLLAVGIWSEDPTTLTFFLEVDELTTASPRPIPYGDPVYELRFLHGLQGYRLRVEMHLENSGTSAFGDPASIAWLDQEAEEESFRRIGEVALRVEDNVVLLDVPRAWVLNEAHAPLGKGSVVHGLQATATALGWFGVPVVFPNGATADVSAPQAFDEAGQIDRFSPTSYTLQTGQSLHRGDLVAGVADPVRWTNGEATTFAYTIRLANSGDGQRIVQVETTGGDPRWQVSFTDRYEVPGRSAINITVHVAIPFTHAHGRLQQMTVEFTSVDGGHEAKALLGVYWPLVPQPAGHHDTLWLHSRTTQPSNPFAVTEGGATAWMSAAEGDVEQADEGVRVPAQRITPVGDGRSMAHWRVLLEPSLRMGLDFDLSRGAVFTLPFHLPAPVQDPTFGITLKHVDTRFILPKHHLLLAGETSMAGSVSGDLTVELADLMPVAGADLIPYVSSADLELNITLTGVMAGLGAANPEEATPSLVPPGSRIELPLFEYHDPLNSIFFTDASATVTAGDQGLEKDVNAGEQVVYNLFLSYQGVFTTDFVVELGGHQASWARVLGAQRFAMEPGQTREVAIAVAPPLGTPPQSFDTVVRCISTTNAAVQAGLVVRTSVLQGVDVEDETELAEAKEQDLAPPPAPDRPWWPWLSLLVVPLAVATVIWLRHR